MTLEGRTAIVTGAAGGLGAAVAAKLGGLGAHLVLVDLDDARLAATQVELSDSGYACTSVTGDVADPETMHSAAETAVQRFGDVTILANVAGISTPVALRDITPEIFDRFMHTNCLSHLLGAQSVIPQMERAGGGSIINVSSVGGLVALPRLAAYCASKAAILGLTRSIAYEYASSNIRCNAICPGGIDTPMAAEVVASFPSREEALSKLTGRQLVNRFATPEEIASLVVYLAGDESVFVNGAVISIDAGHTSW